METSLQSPSVESFSYTWLSIPFDGDGDGDATYDNDYASFLRQNDEALAHASFIEMDPRMPPSQRFIRIPSDLGFDFPVAQPPLSLVHADQLISNGFLVPAIPANDSKDDRLDVDGCCASTASVPSTARETADSSGWVRFLGLRRCRKLSKRVFGKYLKLLFRPFFCKRRVNDFASMNKKWGFATANSTPRSSITYSVDDNWRRSCDSESSIYEAVLHCKRSTRDLDELKKMN